MTTITLRIYFKKWAKPVMKREKRTLDMAPATLPMIFDTFDTASGYPATTNTPIIVQKLNKIAHHQDLVSKRLRLLEYRHLMEGAVQTETEELDLSTFITKRLQLITTLIITDCLLILTLNQDWQRRLMRTCLIELYKTSLEMFSSTARRRSTFFWKKDNRLVLEIDNLSKSYQEYRQSQQSFLFWKYVRYRRTFWFLLLRNGSSLEWNEASHWWRMVFGLHLSLIEETSSIS